MVRLAHSFPANKGALLKVWLLVFCCTGTCAVDCRVMENYMTDAFVSAFVRLVCHFGYPKLLMPDEGSQLIWGCENMVLSFSDIHHKITTEYGIEFTPCPVGAHYVNGKVERKIQQIKKSLLTTLGKSWISVLQWETVSQQISNSINNLPIGLGNNVESLENMDILTPNRLILGRNNNRNPNLTLNNEEETLFHLFCSCDSTISFYTLVVSWIIRRNEIISRKRNNISRERNIISRERNN